MNNFSSFIQNIVHQLEQNMQDMNETQRSAISMIQKENYSGCKELAQNICKTKGISVDDAMNRLKQMLRIK